MQPSGSGIPSLGIISLSAILKERGYKNVTVCDICEDVPYHERTMTYFKEHLQKKPDIVAFTSITPTWQRTKNLIKMARPYCKTIILGGPHACVFKEKVLDDCPEIDILVYGEADNTIYDLVKAIEKKQKINVPGVIYKRGKKIITMPPNVYVDNLDDYPFPDRDAININSYRVPFSILTSRGCPYNCEFCFKHVSGFKWRSRSAENVVAEIEYLIERYPEIAKGSHKTISIVDDNFNYDINRAKKICDMIIEKKLDVEIRAVNGFHVKNVDSELFEKARRSGFKEIWFGVESGNDGILKNLRKGITKDDVRRAVKLAKQAGIEIVGAHFIIGLSGETYSTAMETIKFAEELELDNMGFNHANILPGTRLWDYVQKDGKILCEYDGMDFSKFWQTSELPIFETSEFTKEERIKAREKAMILTTKVVRKKVMSLRNIQRFIFRKNSYKDAFWAIKRMYALYFKEKTGVVRNTTIKPSEM